MIDHGQEIFSNGVSFSIDGLGMKVTVEGDDGYPHSERLDATDALGEWLRAVLADSARDDEED